MYELSLALIALELSLALIALDLYIPGLSYQETAERIIGTLAERGLTLTLQSS